MVQNNEAYGWKDKLRNPEHELPGSYAIDDENHIFIATGVNDYGGEKYCIVSEV